MIIENKKYNFEFGEDTLEIYVEENENKQVLFDSKKVPQNLKSKEEQEKYINEYILPLFEQMKGEQ